MIKALREAKVNTSWVSPNGPYEDAVAGFVDAILARTPDNEFLREFLPLQRRLSRCGFFSSLSQTLLKMTSPGIPDFYQGTELIEFTLVDPDNRRQVDYGRRIDALAELKRREQEEGAPRLWSELLEREDERAKLFLIYRVLNYRREHKDVFDGGEYLPLEVKGARGRHLCAFARKAGGRVVIVAAARLVATLMPEEGSSPLGEAVWQDTVLLLPEGVGGRFRNGVNDATVEAVPHDDQSALPLAALFAEVSVALLESE